MHIVGWSRVDETDANVNNHDHDLDDDYVIEFSDDEVYNNCTT